MFATCNLSLIPVRREPSDRSEIVSQLLFGESVEIIEENSNWKRVRMTFDDYTGWVDGKQIVSVSDDEFKKVNSEITTLSSDLVQLAIWNKNQICPVVIGSTLPCYNDAAFKIGETRYSYEGNVLKIDKPDSERLLEHAYMYLNSPYLWGGRSPFGIDCSGLTQMVYKLCGYTLPRDAYLQAEQGTPVHLLDEARPGDLVFFDNAEERITHVGIILPDNHIIHASGKVRIDRLDHQGIYNEDLKKYSHNLRLIKRIF